jgi:hypothetical protein
MSIISIGLTTHNNRVAFFKLSGKLGSVSKTSSLPRRAETVSGGLLSRASTYCIKLLSVKLKEHSVLEVEHSCSNCSILPRDNVELWESICLRLCTLGNSQKNSKRRRSRTVTWKFPLYKLLGYLENLQLLQLE